MATEVEVVVETEVQSPAIVDLPQDESDAPPQKGLRRLLKWGKNKDGEEKKKSRKPPGNKWLQQQIPACRPVFTATHVFFVFITLGVLFIALGILFLVTAVQLHEEQITYTNCAPVDTLNDSEGTVRPAEFDTCEDYLRAIANRSNVERGDNTSTSDCHCRVNFTVHEDLRPPWYMYYSLGNYFQNHRRFVNSWDVNQLRGENLRNPSDDCRPLRRANPGNGSEPIYPCGLIANSWFNDSFDEFVSLDNSDQDILCCDRTDIAWRTDRDVRFSNPSGFDENPNVLEDTTMPPNWPRDLLDIPDGLENESLIVWYRVSAFPVFRKLYGRVNINGSTDATLPRGRYSVSLTYNYPVANFNGKKHIVLAEMSWLGGKNLFLGIAYIFTGAVSIITGTVLLLVHLFLSRWKLTDQDFLKRKF